MQRSIIIIGLRTGDIHLFDFDYWSIQFWMFWNLILTYMLLLGLIRTKKRMSNQQSLIARLTSAVPSMRYTGSPRLSLAYAFVILLLVSTPAFFYFNSTAAVEGVQSPIASSHVVPTIAPTNAPHPTNPITPMPTKKPAVMKPAEKEYGGWYWQPELARSQRWLGTDSQGNDIWSDTAE